MKRPTVLCVLTEAAVSGCEFEETLTDFRVVRATEVISKLTPLSLDGMDAVLVTGGMACDDAVAAIERLRLLDPAMPVLFWDPDMRATDAVRLIRAGAHHCLGYRDSYPELREALFSAAESRRRALQIRRKNGNEGWREFLVGECHAMETLAEAIRLVGPRRCTVLITGETGTGKEMVARALHMASPRLGQPMVSINCSALPENLLEAELFGHVKGAFTGAINSRVGRFELANRGTLFLDEIADMPLELQAKLLRVLQDREIQRLGSSENIKVDVRVIAATNADLPERVRQGRFREDLYYRLNVVPLEVPPLRKRDSDIPLLAEHFLRKICQAEEIPLKQLSPEALKRLRANSWPGNVRQLENAVEMAVALSGDREMLHAADFGLSKAPALEFVSTTVATGAVDTPEGVDFATAVSQFEHAMLRKALARTAGNRTAAAELLGMKRTTLIMKLRSFEASGILRAS
ncbi:MAG TPA: sigma-54 dependent transcriptional regulator [Bryobacteraceae bacterium]|nr:sigma-54 dependent transcriptional regulator [Bryobacteraceae bacterium]